MNNLNTLLESVNNVSIKETTDYLSFSNSIMDMSTSLYESTIADTLGNFAKMVKKFFDNAINFIKKLFSSNWKDPIKEILKNEKKIVKWLDAHSEVSLELEGISFNNKITPSEYSEWIYTFISDIKVKNFEKGSVVIGPDIAWKRSTFDTKVSNIDFNVSKRLFYTEKKLIKELVYAKNNYDKMLKNDENFEDYKEKIKIMMQETTRIIEALQYIIQDQIDFYIRKTL